MAEYVREGKKGFASRITKAFFKPSKRGEKGEKEHIGKRKREEKKGKDMYSSEIDHTARRGKEKKTCSCEESSLHSKGGGGGSL